MILRRIIFDPKKNTQNRAVTRANTGFSPNSKKAFALMTLLRGQTVPGQPGTQLPPRLGAGAPTGTDVPAVGTTATGAPAAPGAGAPPRPPFAKAKKQPKAGRRKRLPGCPRRRHPLPAVDANRRGQSQLPPQPPYTGGVDAPGGATGVASGCKGDAPDGATVTLRYMGRCPIPRPPPLPTGQQVREGCRCDGSGEAAGPHGVWGGSPCPGARSSARAGGRDGRAAPSGAGVSAGGLFGLAQRGY
jgi:hypothetical protein